MAKPISASEFELQCALRQWLSYQYPNVICHCDLSGIRVSAGLARKIKRLNPARGYPDMFIAEPHGGFHGLFIEVKRRRADLYTSKGKLKTNRHIQEQDQMLSALKARGYKAVFACGFSEAKNTIEQYLKR